MSQRWRNVNASIRRIRRLLSLEKPAARPALAEASAEQDETEEQQPEL